MSNYYTDEESLRSILDCGIDDLDLIRNIKYDIYDIVTDLKNNDIYPSLGNVMYECLEFARDELSDAVNDCLNDIENGVLVVTKEEKKKLEELAPYDDLQMDFNFIATEVYLKHKDVYMEYMPEKIEEIEEKLGFDIMEID